MLSSALLRIPKGARKWLAGGILYFAVSIGALGLLSIGGFMESTEEKCNGHLWAKECVQVGIPLSERLPYLFASLGLVTMALFGVYVAFQLIATQGHLKKYQAILTGVEVMKIAQIADITHRSPTKVRTEIQRLIDSEEISDFYIDYSADQVVSRKYIPKTSHKTVVKCSECGGNNEVIVGITKHCSFCGQPLLLGTTRAT